jgi:hypothetical protein
MRTCIHIVFRPGIGTVLKFALSTCLHGSKTIIVLCQHGQQKAWNLIVDNFQAWNLIVDNVNRSHTNLSIRFQFELMRFVQGNAAIFQDLYGTANRTHDIFNTLSSYCNPLSWIRNINHRKFIEHESWAIPKKLEQNSVS